MRQPSRSPRRCCGESRRRLREICRGVSGSRARRDQRRASSRTGIRGGRHRAGCTAGRCRGVDLSGRRCTGCAVGPADRRRPAGRGLAGSVGIGRNRPPGSALRDRGGHRCRTGRGRRRAGTTARAAGPTAGGTAGGRGANRRPAIRRTAVVAGLLGCGAGRHRRWCGPHRGQHPDRAVRRRRHRGGLGRVGNRRHRRGGCRLPGRGHSSGRPYDGGVRGALGRGPVPGSGSDGAAPWLDFRRRDLRSRARVGSRLAGLSSPGRLADRRTGGPGLGSSGHVHLGPRWCCA